MREWVTEIWKMEKKRYLSKTTVNLFVSLWLTMPKSYYMYKQIAFKDERGTEINKYLTTHSQRKTAAADVTFLGKKESEKGRKWSENYQNRRVLFFSPMNTARSEWTASEKME